MLIATCLLPPEAVALERTLDAEPEIVIEAERIAAHSTHWTMPCLWVSGPDHEAAESLLSNDPSIESIVGVRRFGDEVHYHVEWIAPVQARIDTYVDMQATILDARADADGWVLELRFASREQFDAFRAHLDSQGHSFQLLQLTEPGASRDRVGSLTPEQRAVLEAAAANGYFAVPRAITTRELAEELDTSHQSLSELLRRGIENLVTAQLGSALDEGRRQVTESPR